MLRRVCPDVFGTVECKWAAEKIKRSPVSIPKRIDGSVCTGTVASDCTRVSDLTSLGAAFLPVLFQSW